MNKKHQFHVIFFIVMIICLTGALPFSATAAVFNLSLIPNDAYVNSQSYLEQIKAFEAWDISRQSPEVVVAVIDSGVDIDHPDLENNIGGRQKRNLR